MNELSIQAPLRDIITIPERVDASDFVLQLHSGVTHADRTLNEYFVTEGIATALDDALGLASGALADGASKGAFIHGSFGSGKSHFMAVLHLLLTGNLKARALPGLQNVIAKRQPLLDRKLFAVDYHLMGAASLEQALFQGYINAVREKHPEALLPVLHQTDSMFADAKKLRADMGDERFFAALGGSSADSGWGDLDAGWDAETFDAAISAPSNDHERQRLARDLIGKWFQSLETGGEWVPIADGIHAIAEHAKSLGYEGLVLFLDELVLWLGQHLTDTGFVEREASKVAKLVETGSGSLPVPLISYIARQRDLKDFIGTTGGVGAEQVRVADSFQWWEDRFSRIDLAAADLPKIVKQRLLAPTSPEAGSVLNTALQRVRANNSAWGYLLSDDHGSGEKDFGDVYPFSPAIVDAMVALSTIMQRERTALKIMSEMLVDGRDVLTASDVIPVGDLFDYVVESSSTPLTSEMRKLFEVAGRFYRDKMRPYLLDKYHLSDADMLTLPREAPFRTEDRLIKTLLLGQIAPQAPSLRNLSAGKLAALNFGTIKAFIPGQESQQVLTFARQWAERFGEFSIGEGADPAITMALSGVDYDSILERVRTEDNSANRRRALRALVTEQLGIDDTGFVPERYFSHVWRGHKKSVRVRFGNIADESQVADADFVTNPGDDWLVVIDFPYDDDETRTPLHDITRLENLNKVAGGSTTIAWVPNFFTHQRLEDLGRYVLLDYVLKGQHFEQNADHLPPSDQHAAKTALTSQRQSLRESLIKALNQAYGVSAPGADIERTLTSGSEIFFTFFTGLTLAQPSTDSLKRGLLQTVESAWAAEHPDHPTFEPSDKQVTLSELNSAFTKVSEAVERGQNGRLDGIDTATQRLLRRIVPPLKLGTINDNVLAVNPATFLWNDAFARVAGSASFVDVASLREVLAGTGMTSQMEDAIILTWALIDNRDWQRKTGFGIGSPNIGALDETWTAARSNMPDADVWETAKQRAEALFGIRDAGTLVSSAVRRLDANLRRTASEKLPEVRELEDALVSSQGSLALSDDSARLHAVRQLKDLLEKLGVWGEVAEGLGGARFSDDEFAGMVSALREARAVGSALRTTNWTMIDAATAWHDVRADKALADLRAAAAAPEHQQRLVDVIRMTDAVIDEVAVERAGGASVPTQGTGRVAPQPGDRRAHELRFGRGELGVQINALSEAIEDEYTSTIGDADQPRKIVIQWHLE